MRNYLFLFLGLSCLFSCKKHDVKTPNPIVGNWKMTGYIHNGEDVYGTVVRACIIDNIYTFSNTNILTVNEGLTKCNPTDPQTITGTYSINSSQTLLSATNNGDTEVDSILILNTTTFKYKQLSNNDIVTNTRVP